MLFENMLPAMLTPGDAPWLFTPEEIDETPSRVAGVPAGAEHAMVSHAALMLHRSGSMLHLPQDTIATATVYFQRFFMLESMRGHVAPLVAAACLGVASKATEHPRRGQDILFWTVKVRLQGGERAPEGIVKFECAKGFGRAIEKLFDMEHEVLRVLNFDLAVDLPYRHLLALADEVLAPQDRAVVHCAAVFINDSFRSYMHVRYDPREIATAALYVAAQYMNLDLDRRARAMQKGGKGFTPWYKVFDCDLGNIVDISNTLLDLYEDSARYGEPT